MTHWRVEIAWKIILCPDELIVSWYFLKFPSSCPVSSDFPPKHDEIKRLFIVLFTYRRRKTFIFILLPSKDAPRRIRRKAAKVAGNLSPRTTFSQKICLATEVLFSSTGKFFFAQESGIAVHERINRRNRRIIMLSWLQAAAMRWEITFYGFTIRPIMRFWWDLRGDWSGSWLNAVNRWRASNSL